MTDISRDVAEELRRLRRSADEMADFFQNAPVALHWVGPDGVIQRANRAELALVGCRAEDYVGRHIAEFHVERPVIDDILARLRAGETVWERPSRLRRADGSIHDVLITSSPLMQDGRFLHSRCLTRDVTEVRIAEEARARLAAIIESSDDAIIGKNLDGIVTSWNGGAERIFGWTAAEAVGGSILRIIPPERRDEETVILARLRRGERIDHFETVRRAKDGRLLDISLTVSPIRAADGRIVGASKVARDITDRKRIEREREALLAAEREARLAAEAAGRTKDDFLSLLSHELRTPLTAILGWTIMLRQPDLEPEHRAEALDVIERNARAQTRLVEDLLDVSRIINGKLVLEFRPVAADRVVSAALDVVRHAASAKGVALVADAGPASVTVNGDATRLQQAVWNLLQNAVKFTPRGGRVDVRLAADADRVRITVADTGEGIPAEFLPRLFDRFSQADAGKARRHGGLGLGLALVRHLVEMHGGSVSARSPGRGLGATFTIELPRLPDPHPAHGTDASDPGAPASAMVAA